MMSVKIVEKIRQVRNLESLPMSEIFNRLVKKEDISELVECILSDIANAGFREVKLRKKYHKKISIRRLGSSDLFVALATEFAKNGYDKEAEEIFQTILNRTPDDTSALNDYSAAILNDIVNLYRKKQVKINKTRLVQGKMLVFRAWGIDQCLHEDPRLLPAYKNLCYIRAVEAISYFDEGDYFAAFILGWISIEMSIYRIWYKFLRETFTGSKGKVDDLMRWTVDPVTEALSLSKVDPLFVNLKSDLDRLKGFRNGLIHGSIADVTKGTARDCITIAHKIIPIKQ